jgi:hypothetical protein
MLGSDYHAWIPDIGYQRVFNILPHLTDFEAETIAATMERKYPSQWAKLLEAYENVENLRQSIALFKYCHVLDRDGNLVPLNTLPGGVPWGACIGLEYPFFVLRMLRRSWVLLTSTCRASAVPVYSESFKSSSIRRSHAGSSEQCSKYSSNGGARLYVRN